MTSAFDVPADELISKVAEKLKSGGEISPPQWVKYTKTGSHVQRAPEQADFWYLRCASLLRKIYVNGPVGVSDLRKVYGGRKNRGSRPQKHRDAGGSIIRKGLQQLEKAGLVKKKKEGRTITPKGMGLVDNTAKEIKTAKAVPKA